MKENFLRKTDAIDEATAQSRADDGTPVAVMYDHLTGYYYVEDDPDKLEGDHLELITLVADQQPNQFPAGGISPEKEEKMTKREYIKAHPKSMLASRLREVDWSDDQPIKIIGGLVAPGTKQSNLYKALQGSSLGEYVVGGHRQNGPEGFWIAVA